MAMSRLEWIKKIIMMVVIRVILGGKFGLCTILTIILSGPVIQFTVSKTKKVFNI